MVCSPCSGVILRDVLTVDSIVCQLLVYDDGYGNHPDEHLPLQLSRNHQGVKQSFDEIVAEVGSRRSPHRLRLMVGILDRRQGISLAVWFCPSAGRYDLRHEKRHLTRCHRPVADVHHRTRRRTLLACIPPAPVDGAMGQKHRFHRSNSLLHAGAYLVVQLHARDGSNGCRHLLGLPLPSVAQTAPCPYHLPFRMGCLRFHPLPDLGLIFSTGYNL